MTEIEAILVEEVPRAASVPAGSLHMGHLGALVEVRTGANVIRGRLREVTHDRTMISHAPRTKVNVDLEDGGAAWPYLDPSMPVSIIEWLGAPRA